MAGLQQTTPRAQQYAPATTPQPTAAASPPTPDQLYARNSAYAVKAPNGYLTSLSPQDETQFRDWVKQNNVPFDPSPKADYDMRGFWLAMKNGDPSVKTAINPNDGRLHFTDKFKTPYHMSFSRESQWATGGAPSWNEQDQLVLPNGEIVFDERAQARK